MRFSTSTLGALLLAASATPAFAQDVPVTTTPDAKDAPAAAPAAADKPFKITGGVTLISDYRFRGLTQTNGDGAVQGTININSSAGFYIGTWASTIDGSGKTPLLNGYGDAEVDLYGGYTKTFNGLTVDAGLLYYYYPSHNKSVAPNTDFFEPYASVSYTLGPVSTKVGGNYAWGGQKGLDFTANNKDDNIYVYGEAAVAVPKTPVTLKGHVGYTDGSLGLANLVANDRNYLDWSVTAEAVGGPFKVGVTYVDTDITSSKFGGFYRKGYASTFGRGSSVLGYVGVAF
ncbi:TorF family putative porin [Sphingomonas sp. RB3P16]|uniref:TorF family putative porin n=1 Tax=Parasphingomonas frigoris TaxID=3096163 RepID=UPI002FC8D62D